MTALERYEAASPAIHQDAAVQRLAEWATSAQAAHNVAQSLVRTSFVPEGFRGKPDEATAAILAGLEVGLSPMASLRSFDVIQGQAAPRAITLRAIMQSHGHEIVLVESTATRCKMRGRRRDSNEWQEVVWTIDRAKQLGVTGKANWKNQPQAMLVARATSELARLVASDAILGIGYSAEEIADGAGAGVEVAAVTTADPDAVDSPTKPTGTKRMSRKKPNPQPPDESDITDAEVVDDDKATPAQVQKMAIMFREADIVERDTKLAFVADVIGRPVESSKDLTKDEASKVIEALTPTDTTTEMFPEEEA